MFQCSRKSFFILGILSISIFFFSTSWAQDLTPLISKSRVSKKSLGICLVQNGQIVFSLNPDSPMIPASLSKIPTAISILKSLDPEKRFESSLLVEGSASEGHISSPLYIQTQGDPAFISEELWNLVNHFMREEIRSIEGPIVVDNTLFDKQLFDMTRQKYRVSRAYDAPVSSASFNWNSVNLYVRPAQIGSAAKVFIDPKSDYFLIENKVKTTSGASSSIEVRLDMFKGKERITLSGSIGSSSQEVVKYAAIQNPEKWLGVNLISFLEQRGVEVKNKDVKAGAPPSSARIVSKSKGRTVYEAVHGMMKFSNNFIAEMLTKQLAADQGQKNVGLSDGVKKIQDIILKNYNIELKNFVNPSGFTNENKFSACNLAHLLDRAQKDFEIASSFQASFPRPGGEGTLKRRIQGGEARVRAKTGLLSGAIGLAGYISNSKDEVLSFTFMYNGEMNQQELARQLFDNMALEVSKK